MGEEDCEAVRRVNEELLGGQLDLERELRRLEALSKRPHFPLLYLLYDDEGLSVKDLSECFSCREEEIRYYLQHLEDLGLVGKRRGDDGGRIYELSPYAEQVVGPIIDSLCKRAESVA